MRKINLYLLLFVCFSGMYIHSFAQLQDHVKGEMIVLLEHDQDPLRFSAVLHKVDGEQIRIKKVHTLSQMMNLHLFSFDASKTDENKVLAYMDRHPGVKVVQWNHYISQRVTFPNDTDFGQQWDKNNTGQGGGTPDADIDAPEAWDISTGGLTSAGDTVVIAIIDGGFDLNHVDIDYFKNRNEIPNNGVDDDGNGYIDDYDGWDAYSSSGNVSSSGSHGTHVSGIAGAIGNNNTGISGVCWGAKIMPIGGSSGTESTVVEAYAYTRDMRALYNSTNGSKGAFVVSSNSSFGVNFGDPANYPIWCAMYDSLGMVGVISASATMNTNADVDSQGDIPTACPSDWMIAVTNTTNTDAKNSGAAYGLTTIDLGAPGTGVYSTVPNNNYNSQTGTSMATPQVAGAIALIVSAACPQLIMDYKANPAAVSLIFRDFLFDGVDSVSSLAGITKFEGRLNVFNSLQLVQQWCANGGCVIPFSLNATNITDSSATLNWGSVSSAQSYELRWKATSDTTWINASDTVTSIDIMGLQPCTEYEFQVFSDCDTTQSNWSPSYTFYSEGCCDVPIGLAVLSVNDSSANLAWDSVYAALGYTVQYRPTSSGTWSMASTAGDTAWIWGLDPCTEYEFRVETVCDTGGSGYSNIITFNTKGCGLCAEGAYCSSELNAQDEWINRVSFVTINNTTGSDDGYGDYTSISTGINRGQTYSITLEPDFDFFPFDEYWKVWIDLNQDEDFSDNGELVYDAGGLNNSTVTGTISIPVSAMMGKTRMRVSMRYNTAPNECSMNNFGEVEDYCVTIGDSLVGRSEIQESSRIGIYPNPAHSTVTVFSSEPVKELQLTDLYGRVLIRYAKEFTGEQTLDLNALAPGMYLISVKTEQGISSGKFLKR